jgi:hypothetical protein
MKLTLRKADFLSMAMLVIFVLVIFNGYITGRVAPSWDFYGDYYTQAFSWWDLGNFFHPITYFPYLLSGFPSHLGLQVSSFYLPVGVVAELFTYTIVNAARLQALSIAFGIVGCYLLARKLKVSVSGSLLISIGYLFSAGFFSNATHIDIVRSWVFFPWLLILLFPREKINFALFPVASLIWFQFFIGAYPGNIASFAYVFLAWIVIIIIYAPNLMKATLTFNFLSVLLGLMMASLKWYPFLLGGQGPQIQNQVVVNKGIIATLIFPYSGSALPGDSILPNDITQRTFFVIPLILLFAFFAKRNTFAITTGLTFVILGVILGIDFPFFAHWQESLPLLDLSRFRTIDFKPPISLGLSLLGGLGFDYLKSMSKKLLINLENIFRLLSAIMFMGFIYLLASISQISETDVRTGLNWIIISVILFALIIFLISFKIKILPEILLVVSVGFIGIIWAYQFALPWQTPRIPTENLYFGSSSASAIESRQESVLISRPPRSAPEFPIPFPAGLVFQRYNVWELKREFTMGGYATIKGEKLFQRYISEAQKLENVSIYNYLSLGSDVRIGNSQNSLSDMCVSTKKCLNESGSGAVTSYKPGEIKIDFENINKESRVFINEMNWQGWQVVLCNVQNGCESPVSANDEDNLILNFSVKPDTKSVLLFYETPGMKIAWVLFWSSVFLNTIYLLIRIKSAYWNKRFPIRRKLF